MAVVFAFGLKPALSERQALEVANALAARSELSAHSAATKIRYEARGIETSKDVELDLEELSELADVMNEVAWPDEVEYAYLRRQLSIV
jgi:uncharacterized ferredoxin-like protein